MLDAAGLPAGAFTTTLRTRRPLRGSTRTTETRRGKAAVATSELGGVSSARRPGMVIDPKTIIPRTTSEQKRILLFYPIIPGILLSANLCFLRNTQDRNAIILSCGDPDLFLRVGQVPGWAATKRCWPTAKRPWWNMWPGLCARRLARLL